MTAQENSDLSIAESNADQQAETSGTDSAEKLATPQQVLDYLVERFPNCFTKEGDAKPLKIGIFQDLAERLEDDPKVSKTQLRGVLRHYTQSWRYLHSVKLGAHRVDLDGNQGDVLEQEHVDHAQKQLEESKAKFAEKRKAQQKDKPKKQFKRNDKGPRGDKPQRRKPKSAQNGKPSAPKKPLELAAADAATIKTGQAVQVKLGNNPVAATITEIAKDGVFVQLSSGMVVKAQVENIFTEK